MKKFAFLITFMCAAAFTCSCRAAMVAKTYVDAAVATKVSKTDAETISGTKTFSDVPMIPTAPLPTPQ